MTRRGFMGAVAAAGALPFLPTPALAVPRTIKIGLTTPASGQMATFHQPIPFILEQVQKATGGSIAINGRQHPIEIVVKDQQSNPNRAAEVAQELILQDKVDVIAAFSSPETVNPVSDQSELNGVPCIGSVCPLEPWFFGRSGDPKVGFEWTYCFSFSGDDYGKSIVAFGTSFQSTRWPARCGRTMRTATSLAKSGRSCFSKKATRWSIPAVSICRSATMPHRSRH
ncbi:ABC transporter substrate-binding protein [Ochrobactrum oryzae]|nr:ABC transporter substrate-binding protein [Brucella oryzae]